jgi:phage shock protein A
MEWLSRLGRAMRSQFTHWQEQSLDPEQLLEQAIEEIDRQVIDLRRALAGAIATVKSTERHLDGYHQQAQKWYERAKIAIDKQQDSLAREALTHRQSYLNQAESLAKQLSQQGGVITQLKQDLRILERKQLEAKGKRSLYIARLRSAMANQRMQEILGEAEHGGYSHIFEKIEAKILEFEAQSELAIDPLEKNFAALESQKQIESELQSLKDQRLQLGDSEAKDT